MKRFCLLVLLCIVGIGGHVGAADIPPVVVVYLDNQNNVQVFHQSTGEKTQLYSADEGSVSQIYLSPSGEHVALDTSDGLAVYSLSPVRRLFTRQLIVYPFVPVDPDTDPMGAENQWTAIGVWSPDGSHFAWTEGTPGTGQGEDFHNGDGTVGIFSAVDGQVMILPNEEGMPDDLMWSPDSSYLIYDGVINYGTGAGATFSGTYVVSADGHSHRLPDVRGGIAPLGWLSNSHLIFSYPGSVEGQRGIFDYDPHSDTTTQIVSADQYSIEMAVVDPSDDKIIFTVGTLYSSDVDKPGILQEGMYIIDTPQSLPRLVHKVEDFNAVEMLTPGFILGTQGILRLSDDKLVLPYNPIYRSVYWASDAPYGIVRQDSSAALLNLNSGQMQMLQDVSGGVVAWFAPQNFFAISQNTLFVGTLDGNLTPVLDSVRYQYISPRLVFEPSQSRFPSLPATCPGMLASRLAVGQNGHVIPNTPANYLRLKPDETSEVLTRIPAGDTFSVVDGPVCQNGVAWWKVSYQSVSGWTAELQDNTYFLEPQS